MCPLQVTVKSNNQKREAHDMDSSITLSYGSRATSTVVSNIFIDKYMTDARGSDVKVYT